jgi:hypothetical protein
MNFANYRSALIPILLSCLAGCDGLRADPSPDAGACDGCAPHPDAADAAGARPPVPDAAADARVPDGVVVERVSDARVFEPGGHLAIWPASGPAQAVYTIGADGVVWKCAVQSSPVACGPVVSGVAPATFAPGAALAALDAPGRVHLFAIAKDGALWNGGWQTAGASVWQPASKVTDAGLYEPGAPLTAVYQGETAAPRFPKSWEVFVVGKNGQIASAASWFDPDPLDVWRAPHPLSSEAGTPFDGFASAAPIAAMQRVMPLIDLYGIKDGLVVSATHRDLTQRVAWQPGYRMPSFKSFASRAELTPIVWNAYDIEIVGIDDLGETASVGRWSLSTPAQWSDGAFISAEATFPPGSAVAVALIDDVARLFAVGNDGAVWNGGSRHVASQRWSDGSALTKAALAPKGAALVARAGAGWIGVYVIGNDGALYRVIVR